MIPAPINALRLRTPAARVMMILLLYLITIITILIVSIIDNSPITLSPKMTQRHGFLRLTQDSIPNSEVLAGLGIA